MRRITPRRRRRCPWRARPTGCSVYDDLDDLRLRQAGRRRDRRRRQRGDAGRAEHADHRPGAHATATQIFVDLSDGPRRRLCIGTIRVRRQQQHRHPPGRRPRLDQGRVRCLQPDRAALRSRRYQLEKLSTTWVLFEDDKDLRRAVRPRVLPRAPSRSSTWAAGAGRDQGHRQEGREEGRATSTAPGADHRRRGELERRTEGRPAAAAAPGAGTRSWSGSCSEAPHHVVRLESTSMRDGGELALLGVRRGVERRGAEPQGRHPPA